MATVRKCWRTDCECNNGYCYCEADEVIIGTDGSCLTYNEKDIYAKAEGFKRDD